MARWRLTEPHYLFTDPDTVWERIETDMVTGRQVRKQYVVPAYFHHEIEADWTDKVEKAVIVCDGRSPGKGDIIFKGEPTPGMRPLDDEAKSITAKYEKKWNIPDSIKWGDGQYSVALADHFAEAQTRVNMEASKLAEQNAVGLSKFMETMGIQQNQLIQILQMLAEKSSGAKPTIDDLEPLPKEEEDVKPEASDSRPASPRRAAGRRF